MDPKLFPVDSSHSAVLFWDQENFNSMGTACSVDLSARGKFKLLVQTFGYTPVSGLMLGSEIEGLSAFLLFLFK